jgi:flagellar motor switch protein FliG
MEARNEGVYINGKAQIIEMLQYMQPAEREKLLKNIRLRNASMAQELVRESMTFDVVENLGDEDWQKIFNYVDARILGVALKLSNRNFQRRLLKLAPREYAEIAYDVMTTPIENGVDKSKRAQRRIIEMVSSLSQKRLISY